MEVQSNIHLLNIQNVNRFQKLAVFPHREGYWVSDFSISSLYSKPLGLF